jgi:glycosyltransferase involved in cell wall biosynthesis
VHDLEVIIDGRPLVGNRTGIGVHTAEIAARLDVSPPPLIAAHAEIANRDSIEHCRFRVDRAPLGVLWQQFVLPRIEGDVLWGPHGTLPMAGSAPAVSSLHDFTSITMPSRHELSTIFSFNTFISQSLERARRIAAVSRTIAGEAMRWFAVPHAKIEIVPNGVDEFFSPSGEEEDAYILFVGTLEPRKGVRDLVAVWESLPEPRPRLVLCGDEGWRTRVREHEGITVTGFVDKAKLRDLYRRAMIFAYPSRYEGFGIPPLEAMACGAPVLATRVGAIPDFAEGAAMLVAPGDPDALHDAMVQLIGDRGLRRELRAKGPERATHYRWERSAALMTELLAGAAR